MGTPQRVSLSPATMAAATPAKLAESAASAAITVLRHTGRQAHTHLPEPGFTERRDSRL